MSTTSRRPRTVPEIPADLIESSHAGSEHFSMSHVRKGLRRYQISSPAHFELDIELRQLRYATHNNEQTETSSSTPILQILFQGNSIEGRISIAVSCHVELRARTSKRNLQKCIIVTHTGRTTTLESFLKFTFPVNEAPLQQDTMWRWWRNNGKTFDWGELATELKERIIQFCMHSSHEAGIYTEKVRRFNRRYANGHGIQKPGPLEVVEQLGDWYQLLYVSHQVRAITLRLCITGGSSFIISKGLCLTAFSMRSFSESLDRLGDLYQMIEPDSVPATSQEQALSKCYSRFPKIYPELHRYATLRHGIRKVSLGMNFLSSMRFFKVQVHGFQRLQTARGPTYEVFERLPNLKEIIIRLPLRPRGGWKNSPYAGGPALFHHESPCPRTLHKIIYERIAEVLAVYETLTVRNFIDLQEEQRFNAARLEAIKSLKMTKAELQELYAETDGGIAVPEGTERTAKAMSKVMQEDTGADYPIDVPGGYFPPSCHCDKPCVLSPVFMLSDRHY